MQDRLLENQHTFEVGKLMGFPKKMAGVCAVMAHQAKQRGAIASPVLLPDTGGLMLVDAQVTLDVLPH